MTNETLELMKTRRSIKKYNDQRVSKEQLDTIVEAGIWAANGQGQQATISVVVDDPQKVNELEALHNKVMDHPGAHPFYGAKTVVVVFADSERLTGVEDGALVIGNMMLAAHSIGVGSCWIHRAKEMFDSPEGKALMAKWGVPANYRGVGNCMLGFWDGEYPGLKPRKEGRIIEAK